MNKKRTKVRRRIHEHHESAATSVLESGAGAPAGALAGSVAGPAGAAVGAVIGTLVATAAAEVAHGDAAERREEDEQLDRDLGVTEGDLGAASPDAPPPRIGCFSAAASGAATSSRDEPVEGPIPSDGAE
ncbi:MAG TPA: hypothetical protein VHB21_01645 [Minicystis sp.]|nr:hypothetical protein [Minicystis sp.]